MFDSQALIALFVACVTEWRGPARTYFVIQVYMALKSYMPRLPGELSERGGSFSETWLK
ncbi:hypothetical protein PILCRDRAFT_829942 [Piloderma croceum F 1598]|uniref:Uncharacterized protein n=1 Tax=Piloderma croceum (strain F 1598) TaxID=765440 RepID=A0A0C3EHT9_PILCF|nr:hypothetical protein PILCRDRAFT_829942 [Piloderma croceum F 1598]